MDRRMRLGRGADRGCLGGTNSLGGVQQMHPIISSFSISSKPLKCWQPRNWWGTISCFFFFWGRSLDLGGVGGWAARMTVGLALPCYQKLKSQNGKLLCDRLLIQFCTDIRSQITVKMGWQHGHWACVAVCYFQMCVKILNCVDTH